ncbi:cell division protein ZapB [Agrobacterium tumefaciens]|uniref:cell division protein ZapB n=1 Tax=Agrobacterium tumefaciens TaxID=358 RepID=UPI001575AF71|nr:cell division protein ZapB [Agrobacterium tumefaciens]NTZ90548.1 hypothetical protein [Agrobacterium tumefaciens]
MSVSIKNWNQAAAGNSTSSRAKALAAVPSIRNIFPSGQSSVSRSSTTAQAPKMSSADYLASAAFMRNLRVKLSMAGDDPAQYLRARSMVSALESGRLQVSDPTQGKSINAWDPNQKNAKPTTATDIAKTNWVDFLNSELRTQNSELRTQNSELRTQNSELRTQNSELKRSEDGALSKDGSGSYVDKTSGKQAYFGRVAGKYYYVTWPADTKA